MEFKKFRLDLFRNFVHYTNENCFKATKLYKELAEANGLTLTQMAIAFCTSSKVCDFNDNWCYNYEAITRKYCCFPIPFLSDEIIAEIEKNSELILNQRLNSVQFSVSVSSTALQTETSTETIL